MPGVQERAAAPHRFRDPHASRDRIYSADMHTCAQCRHASPPACAARGLPLMSPIRIAHGLNALIANLLRTLHELWLITYYQTADKKEYQTKRSTRNNRKSNLKRIEGRIKVEASVPNRFCVALETVRMAKFLKSVCLVVQIKGGATLFTTRPCRVLCDKQVASGPRKKPLVGSDAGTWSTGWTSRDARTPTSSQPGLYDRNRGAEAPERPRARGTSQPGSLRALARSCAWCAKRWQRACHWRPSKVKATEGPLQL